MQTVDSTSSALIPAMPNAQGSFRLRTLACIGVIALSYFVVARLSLLLAIPPGYAAAFWPASGIALAGVLLFGYRSWPGVALGSFIANVTISWSDQDFAGLARTLLVPLGIGLGAALQSVIGAWLIRWSVGFPNPLHRERDIANLLVFSGPVSCLVNASIGVSVLWMADRLHMSEVPYTWWVWWIGDTVGAFLVAPAVVIWVVSAPTDWPRRPITVTVPLAVLGGGILSLFVLTDLREREQMRSEFEFQTNSLAQALESRFDRIEEAMFVMRGFHVDPTSGADGRKFATVAQTTLDRRPAIRAFFWAPRVKESDRLAFEKAGTRESQAPWEIRETSSDHRLRRAAARPEYYPIVFRQPSHEEPGMQGLDLTAHADGRHALDLAVSSSEPVASPPFIGGDALAERDYILLFLAVYRDGVPPTTRAQREKTAVGCVVGLLQLRNLVEVAWHGLPYDGINVWLFDDSSSPSKLALLHLDESTAAAPEWSERDAKLAGVQSRRLSIEGAGRRWTLQFQQTPEHVATHRSMRPWIVLAGGMLVMGLLGGVLLVATGRSSLIAALVEERTKKLAQANEALLQEVHDRKRAEARLEESRRFIEHVAEAMPSILFVYDLDEQTFVFINRRIESLLGYSVEQTRRPGSTLWLDQVHPDDLPKLEWASERYQLMEDDEVVEIEYRMRHSNGEYRWLHSRNMIFQRSADGAPRQIIGTIRDVTEHKRLEQQVVEIASAEARRIGQELHDGTGQELTGLCMLAENLAEALSEQGSLEQSGARRITLGLRQALGQVRALSRGLIPVEVDAEGLMAALSDLTSRISQVHGVECKFECLEPVPIDDNYLATQLFRIAQEAITNALKHGRPSQIRVSLEARGYYVTLKIIDDGVGLPERAAPDAGMGLQIMRYRASQIGAQFSIRPAPVRGTIVACTFFRGKVHD